MTKIAFFRTLMTKIAVFVIWWRKLSFMMRSDNKNSRFSHNLLQKIVFFAILWWKPWFFLQSFDGNSIFSQTFDKNTIFFAIFSQKPFFFHAICFDDFRVFLQFFDDKKNRKSEKWQKNGKSWIHWKTSCLWFF